MNGGRPLRFLTITLGGWTAARAIMLWPVATNLPALLPALIPAIGHALASPADAAIARTPIARQSIRAALPAMPRWSPGSGPAPPDRPLIAPTAFINADRGTRPAQPLPVLPAPALPPPFVPAPLARGPSRLAASAWLIARGGAPATLLGSQLGASQTGVRITYALGSARRLAFAARVAAPLHGRGREAAIGIDWQPTSAAFHLVAEQRFSLDGARGGPAVEVIGGFGPRAIAPGVRLEGYGQAGAIARDGVSGFADGAIRATHPIVGRGAARLDLGLGAWGGLQRGAARLDIGPSLGVALPVAGNSVRLALDWRERVAGRAAPGSGPALSIGSDF